LTELGLIALSQGEDDVAHTLAAAALDGARAAGDAETRWYAACLAANVASRRDDHRLAAELHLEAIHYAHQTGPFPLVAARGGLGWAEILSHDYARARETLQAKLAQTSPRDTFERAGTICNLGWAEFFLGDTDRAREHFAESLLLSAEIRQTRLAAELLFAVAALRADEVAVASTLWGAAYGLLAQCGAQPAPYELDVEERWLEPLREPYGPDFELGRTLGLDEAVELALS